MKKSLVALAAGTFALGIAEFVMMGMLPDVATDLGVSIPAAGHFIAAYALAILLTRANLAQSALYALVSACVIQVTTSIPGLNFLTELVAALAMSALVSAGIGGKALNPFVATLVTTLVSGALFAVIGTVLAGLAPAAALVKVPLVLGTAAFNAVVVQALYFPLGKVLGK